MHLKTVRVTELPEIILHCLYFHSRRKNYLRMQILCNVSNNSAIADMT